MINLFKKAFLYRKYRKKVKQKRTINFKLSDPREFLSRLESNGIEYVVLRWHGEAEAILQGEIKPGADIDILVNVDSWKQVFNLAFDLLQKKHGVKFDVYSSLVVKGFQYAGFPYYPRHIADELFAARVKGREGFYRARGLPYIRSLVYHLVYHKGRASGIPLDVGQENAFPAKRNYRDLLRQEALLEGVDIPASLTIRSLFDWLVEQSAEAPYDLLIRYPEKDKYTREIADWMRTSFWDESLLQGDYLYVFMLRDSLEGSACEGDVIQLVTDQFKSVKQLKLESEDRRFLKRYIRGGNWQDKCLDRETLPYLFLIVRDDAPIPVAEPSRRYPLIDNNNFFKKIKIRDQIQELTGMDSNCIHGTDNLNETAYVLSLLKSRGLYG